jgi:DNA-binding CsgD family transcriptional regulator
VNNPWNLTEREQEVLSAIAEHGTDKRAARCLGISHRTVEHHIATARARMGIKDRTSAVLAFDRSQRSKP